MITNRRIPMVAGAAALILVVIWYMALWSPQAKQLKAAHKAHAAAMQQIAQLQSQKDQLQGLVKQIPADTALFTQLEAALPDNPQLDQALKLLHQAADSAGVKLLSLSPSHPATPGSAQSGGQQTGVPSVALTMNVQGSNAQVQSFLSALDAMPRTVVVDSLSISGGSSGSASIGARVFYAGQPTP